MPFSCFLLAQRDGIRIDFPLHCCVEDAGCGLQSLSSATKMLQNLSLNLAGFGDRHRERQGWQGRDLVLVWSSHTGCCCTFLDLWLSFFIVFFFFSLPELCFSSTMSIGLEMAFNWDGKAYGLFVQELDEMVYEIHNCPLLFLDSSISTVISK